MIPEIGDMAKGSRYFDKASDLLKLGDKVVNLEKTTTKLNKGISLSNKGKYADRLDYLHRKYGKMSSSELHAEINRPELRRMLKDYSPSKVAKEWQGSAPYFGVDDYVDKVYKKGTKLYAGEPFPTGYFSTKDAILKSNKDATKLFEGLQVKPYYTKGMEHAIQRTDGRVCFEC